MTLEEVSQKEVEELWPLSENYEYVAELGLALRMHFPQIWETWQDGDILQRYSIPQALAFQFFLFCEQKHPDLLRQSLPMLLSQAPTRLIQEWRASLLSPEKHTQQEDTPSSPEEAVHLFSHPFLAEYNEQSMRLHRWSKEAWSRVRPHTATPAEVRHLERVHAGFYLRGIRDFAQKGGGPLTPETRVQTNSWETILLASGATIEATKWALQNGTQALTEIAPGSHHAGRSRACGTCLVNHLAVAAEWARGQAGIERVAILDIDAHHGNGSEEIFWDRDDVLTVSVHQKQPFFPGTGSERDQGSGRGRGFNRNIEVQKDWLGAIEKATAEVERFQPQLLLVQFGADAHWSDRASDLRANADDFQRAGELIANLCIPLVVELGSATSRQAWKSSLRGLLRGLQSAS